MTKRPLLFSALLLLLGGCATTPEPVQVSEVEAAKWELLFCSHPVSEADLKKTKTSYAPVFLGVEAQEVIVIVRFNNRAGVRVSCYLQKRR